MIIGKRLRTLREAKGLSQGDIEKATGLLRCYISRVEHGHTIPSLETLARFAEALDVPLYQLFYLGEDVPPTPHLTARRSLEELAKDSGASEKEARYLVKLDGLIQRIARPDRKLILDFARMLATRRAP